MAAGFEVGIVTVLTLKPNQPYLKEIIMNEITLFNNADSSTVVFMDKKERKFELSNEAALFKGGAALKALKDQALFIAANKAANGRYRAAADILAVAFPKQHKAFVGFLNCEPWANASKLSLFIEKCEAADKPAKGWSAKQHSARALMAAMREGIPALAADRASHVIEA